MDDDYIKHKEKENIVPIKLKNKMEYIKALSNLEYSWTGRVDAMYANTFFQEAKQLIVNAIVLYEMGYFDNAFYSLRQSLELSTTIIYFVDDSEQNRKESLKKWKNQDKFPGYKQMNDELKERIGTFSDIKSKMQAYFSEIEVIKNQLNKYVHKQGFDKFYIVRNHFIHRNKYPQEQLTEVFEKFLIKSIGAVGVLRLAVDPLPILLMDKDIYNRTGQFLTEGYTEDFVKKYIGMKHIKEYKKTDLYIDHYETFIKLEEMLPAVVDLVKYEYIDRNKIDEILSQKHLLSAKEAITVVLVLFSEKIAKVYCGLSWYHTNIDSKRSKKSWSSDDFTTEKVKQNTPYDEVFLTHFNIGSEDYFVEHNEKFDKTELTNIQKELLKLTL